MSPEGGKIGSTTGILACSECHSRLDEQAGSLRCTGCGAVFAANSSGFYEMLVDDALGEIVTTTDEHAERQESEGAYRMDEEFVIPYILGEPFTRVLDVGCGVGRTVSQLLEMGHDAYGIDLPNLAAYWRRGSLQPERFFCADATRLPFPDETFDTVVSFGVIEHIGTVVGDCTLADDYQAQRQSYADELLRVSRPGGRILVACPNKSFPIDHQHRVTDACSPAGGITRVREWIYDRSGLNIHPVRGRYHLLSYGEVRELFTTRGAGSTFAPRSIRGYFGFSKFDRGRMGVVGKLVQAYVNGIPSSLQQTCLNPYMMAEIRK